MTPEERQLVSGLFDRMRGFGSPEKDREAETLINDAVRAMPDAPYMLVQSVLVQEHALQQANERIGALEEQVRSLQGQGAGQAGGSGSFLGGLFGGGRPAAEPRAASVPQIGSRAVPLPGDDRTPLTPQAAPSPAGAPWQQAAAGGGGGSFLGTAMATAAGVAGGMLAAGAIRDLMGGSHTHANPASNAATTGAGSGSTNATAATAPETRTEPARTEQARNDQQAQDHQQDADQDQLQDASWDDDGGGFSDLGGDLDI
jgi:hypothetical protein